MTCSQRSNANKLLRNKDRRRARKIVHSHIGTDVFLAAQNWTCPICSEPLTVNDDLSVDHVYHLAASDKQHGNFLLTHVKCNIDKRDRHPSRQEQEMLGLVNRCLRYRKDIYRAAKPWKGMKPVSFHTDFLKFSLAVVKCLIRKVFHRA